LQLFRCALSTSTVASRIFIMRFIRRCFFKAGP
jgi:hypothetical protein